VKVRVLAEGVGRSFVRPKLFFRRIDVDDGTSVPQPGSLVEGHQEWSVHRKRPTAATAADGLRA
jgi:hypothetical protein